MLAARSRRFSAVASFLFTNVYKHDAGSFALRAIANYSRQKKTPFVGGCLRAAGRTNRDEKHHVEKVKRDRVCRTFSFPDGSVQRRR